MKIWMFLHIDFSSSSEVDRANFLCF